MQSNTLKYSYNTFWGGGRRTCFCAQKWCCCEGDAHTHRLHTQMHEFIYNRVTSTILQPFWYQMTLVKVWFVKQPKFVSKPRHDFKVLWWYVQILLTVDLQFNLSTYSTVMFSLYRNFTWFLDLMMMVIGILYA